MGKPRVKCYAGMQIGEDACRCGIEGKNLLPETDPTTLAVHCYDRYDLCSTWRAYKEAQWEDRHRALEREVKAATPAGER